MYSTAREVPSFARTTIRLSRLDIPTPSKANNPTELLGCSLRQINVNLTQVLLNQLCDNLALALTSDKR